jgi:pimeloyl-ACP methyl ester carboxylesterase
MAFMMYDGLAFHYREQGEGTPFIFQHGLGGDVNQTFDIFTPPPGFRLVTMDCRGHGETRPLDDPLKVSLGTFADDLVALMTHLHIQRAVVGGISMGAAVALNFTLRFPERVLGLVLSRPAWLDRPNAANLEIFGTIARLIRQHGSQRGLELFRQSAIYADILRRSPDAANSLVGQFEHPRAEETVVKLERIPQDAPNHDRREWASIRVPTLILANQQDPVHPYAYAEQYAQVIPNTEFKEVTAKSVSKELHKRDVQAAIEAFLVGHFSDQTQERTLPC